MLNEKPIIALMYDFDKTLCTKDMQEYTFIPNLGMTAKEFWSAANQLASDNKMDGILAYMWTMLDKAHVSKVSIRREEFVKLGKDLEFYKGVTDWFDRINVFGDTVGVDVEHYIISSGLKEIIEGSEIYHNFKEVFASEYLYDENDIACWPKNAVNYTTKTQFPFRINKGVLDISNDIDLNGFTPEDNRRVPFRNMLYIGDGLTDVPCMKQVKSKGGFSIAVYQESKREKVEDLIIHDRVDFISPADYTVGSDLELLVQDIINKMAKVDALKRRNKIQLESISINN